MSQSANYGSSCNPSTPSLETTNRAYSVEGIVKHLRDNYNQISSSYDEFNNQSTTDFNNRLKPSEDHDHITINTDYLEVSIKLKDPPSSFNLRGSSSSQSPKNVFNAQFPSSLKNDPIPFIDVFRSDRPNLDTSTTEIGASNTNNNIKSLRSDEIVDYLSLEQSRKARLIPVNPYKLCEKLLQCHQCEPSVKFTTRIDAFGHLQNVHGLKYCPVCFQLINCQENYMQEHLKQNHFINLQGDVHCPICFNTFNHVLCYDHISKRHLKSLDDYIAAAPESTSSLNILNKPFLLGETTSFLPPAEDLEDEQPDSQSGEESYGFPLPDTEIKVQPLKITYRKNVSDKATKTILNSVLMGKSKSSKMVNSLVLKNFFLKNKFPSSLDKLELARKTGQSSSKVSKWFTGKRKIAALLENNGILSWQTEFLLSAFHKNFNPGIQERKAVALEVGLTFTDVSIWYILQRKIAKLSRTGAPKKTHPQKNINILPVSTTSNYQQKISPDVPGSSTNSFQQHGSSAGKKLVPTSNFHRRKQFIKPMNDFNIKQSNLPTNQQLQNSPASGATTTSTDFQRGPKTCFVKNKIKRTRVRSAMPRMVIPPFAKRILMQLWDRKHYPTTVEVECMMEKTELDRAQIQMFFRNQRLKLNQNSNLKNIRSSRKHFTTFNKSQLETMIENFNSNVRPSKEEIAVISNLVNISAEKVAQWYRNRLRRLKSGALPGYSIKNGLVIKIEDPCTTQSSTVKPEKPCRKSQSPKKDIKLTLFENTEMASKNATPCEMELETRIHSSGHSSFSQLFTRTPVVKLKKLPDLGKNTVCLTTEGKLIQWAECNVSAAKESISALTIKKNRSPQSIEVSTPRGKSPRDCHQVQNLASPKKIELPETVLQVNPSKSSARGRPRNSKKHHSGNRSKHAFSEQQTTILLDHFQKSQKPGVDEIQRLSEITKLTTIQIPAWFSMRRFITRRDDPEKSMGKIKKTNLEETEIEETIPTTGTAIPRKEKCKPLENFPENLASCSDAIKKISISSEMENQDEEPFQKDLSTKRNIELPSEVTKIGSPKLGKNHTKKISPVVARFASIRKMKPSLFKENVTLCLLNFKNLLETYISCEIEGQEIIDNETNRLQDLINLHQLRFTSSQEDFLIDMRLEIMNELLKNKGSDNQWGDVVAKFHIKDMFCAWHLIGVYACLRKTSLNEAIEDLWLGLSVCEDELFVSPKWLIPTLLVEK